MMGAQVHCGQMFPGVELEGRGRAPGGGGCVGRGLAARTYIHAGHEQ